MDEFPLSLYLELEQGEHADLAVVSRAAIAFAALIEAAALEFQPSRAVRVEIVSGSEGSLGLNTVTRWVARAQSFTLDFRQTVTEQWKKRPSTRVITYFILFRLANNSFDWTQDQFMDWLAGPKAPPEASSMSSEDRHALAEEIVDACRRDIGVIPLREVYRQVARDPKIAGVGVTIMPRQIPAQIVQKAEFHSFIKEEKADSGDVRVRLSRLTVTLVSPVLLRGERRWRFASATSEFGAPVKDQAFLTLALSGEALIPLRSGVEMDIEIEITEEHRDGVWQITSRSVTHVYGWRAGAEQASFLDTLANNVEPNGNTE